MKVKLLQLKVDHRHIQSIKALRAATHPLLGLKESKDIVDSMRDAGATPEVTVDFTDQRDEALKLFVVTTQSGRTVLILSAEKSTAEDIVQKETGELFQVSREITGPFEDGTILADFED